MLNFQFVMVKFHLKSCFSWKNIWNVDSFSFCMPMPRSVQSLVIQSWWSTKSSILKFLTFHQQHLITGMSCLGMSCPSWQWHRTGSCWSPVWLRTLLVAPLWCDLGFVPNSCGNRAAANLCPNNILKKKSISNQIFHRKEAIWWLCGVLGFKALNKVLRQAPYVYPEVF